MSRKKTENVYVEQTFEGLQSSEKEFGGGEEVAVNLENEQMSK